IKSLGYVEVITDDMERWRTLAFDVLGFATGTGPDDDALYLRMDERYARIIVRPGETDRVALVGWEVRDHLALARVRERLVAAGDEVTDLSQAEADARKVEAANAFTDPAGTATEVFFGPVLDHSPVVTPHGARFVTGGQGLGHVVLPVPDPDAALTFYAEVLEFLPRGAFRLPTPPEVGPMRIRFLGINESDHSLSLTPSPTHGTRLLDIT